MRLRWSRALSYAPTTVPLAGATTGCPKLENESAGREKRSPSKFRPVIATGSVDKIDCVSLAPGM